MNDCATGLAADRETGRETGRETSHETDPEMKVTAANRVLEEVFGYTNFRPGQKDAVTALCTGRDTVVLLPTGAGKSLCYQVPAIVKHRQGLGCAIVVSPLIALMEDQVGALASRGVRCAALHSHQDAAHQMSIISELRAGKLCVLYVSPERASLPSFLRLLSQMKVSLIAIDEAHCVSQWGHDFRPAYLSLDCLRTTLQSTGNPLPDKGAPPIIALTATATHKVLAEIETHLHMDRPVKVVGDFARPNLAFSVFSERSEAGRLRLLLQQLDTMGFRGTGAPGRAIVYCSTRKKVETVSEALRKSGFAAGYYHAGRTALAREKVQRAFAVSRHKVLVATNAFGMGIDLPDIRLVAHFQAPGSLSAYYQEAGRAGRDGSPSACWMFFGPGDMYVQRRFIDNGGNATTGSLVRQHRYQGLAAIEGYAQTETCRQVVLCSHFTGRKDHQVCGVCDVCLGTHSETSERKEHGSSFLGDGVSDEMAESDLDIIVAALGNASLPVGKTNLAKALRGSKSKSLERGGLWKIKEHGAMKHFSQESILRAIETLIDRGKIVRRGHKYPTIWPKGKAVPTRSASTPRKITQNGLQAKRSPALSSRAFSDIRRGLDNYRRRKAKSLQWKPYMVFQKQVILAIEARMPTTSQELLGIPGLGPSKVDKFGDDILRIVRECS